MAMFAATGAYAQDIDMEQVAEKIDSLVAAKKNEEIVDIAVTSTNEYGTHPLFDELLGKKIRLKVEILE